MKIIIRLKTIAWTRIGRKKSVLPRTNFQDPQKGCGDNNPNEFQTNLVGEIP